MKMIQQKLFFKFIGPILLILIIGGCSTAEPPPESIATTPLPPTNTSEPPTSTPLPSTSTPEPPTSTPTSTPIIPTNTPEPPTITPTPEVVGLWEDVTSSTIGRIQDWTNKLELADINGDGLVDILFANGGNSNAPGDPEQSRVFLNQGDGARFEQVSKEIFPDRMLAEVIKVRDLNADGHPDIIVGTTYETQSRLYLGDGTGKFSDVTTTHLPNINASIGDLEVGDVDADGDLDLVLADWGIGNPEENDGGRTKLWLNDGSGHFTDATITSMPTSLVKFSWELELVDVDNDYDLDILVSCRNCKGSFQFENDGNGMFTDVSEGNLPQYRNNYDFEAMDLDGDSYLDLVTINDGANRGESVFLNNQQGGYEDVSAEFWPASENIELSDDSLNKFLDVDSDGDADVLVVSLVVRYESSDRLMVNDGTGRLHMDETVFGRSITRGSTYIGLADLNGDKRLDAVMAQGEVDGAFDDRVFFGSNIPPDTAPPIISIVEAVTVPDAGQPVQIRARVHDNKSPTMPHDWQSVVLHWTVDGETHEIPMEWYGEYLWRATIEEPPAGEYQYEVCATDVAGNAACASP